MSRQFSSEMMITAALPPYPAYRPSGVEWLGDIPAHWEITRLKFLAPFRYGDSLAEDAREAGDVVVFGSNGPVGMHSRPNTAGPCLIIGRKGSFGKVNWSADPCFAIDTTFFVDSVHSRADLRWLHYALPLLKLDSLSQDSAVPGLSRGFAHEQCLPDVPLPEQRAIAGYLDRATARIDALIAAKERLLEMLSEKRRALISHAVTKGLDPSAPMKDSGDSRLGNVPQGWAVKPLGVVAHLQRGHDLPSSAREAGPVPVVSSSGVSDWHIRAKVAGPGVVTGRYGTVGAVYYVAEDYWPLNTALYVCDFNGNEARFVYYVLQTLPYEVFSGKSAVPGIDRNDLHPLPVCCPSLAEQRAIAAYLDRETARLDALAGKVRAAIERLREYRAALISAGVTGKVDVRGWQRRDDNE
jgi:type I restriction enzyme, S subunit